MELKDIILKKKRNFYCVKRRKMATSLFYGDYYTSEEDEGGATDAKIYYRKRKDGKIDLDGQFYIQVKDPVKHKYKAIPITADVTHVPNLAKISGSTPNTIQAKGVFYVAKMVSVQPYMEKYGSLLTLEGMKIQEQHLEKIVVQQLQEVKYKLYGEDEPVFDIGTKPGMKKMETFPYVVHVDLLLEDLPKLEIGDFALLFISEVPVLRTPDGFAWAADTKKLKWKKHELDNTLAITKEMALAGMEQLEKDYLLEQTQPIIKEKDQQIAAKDQQIQDLMNQLSLMEERLENQSIIESAVQAVQDQPESVNNMLEYPIEQNATRVQDFYSFHQKKIHTSIPEFKAGGEVTAYDWLITSLATLRKHGVAKSVVASALESRLGPSERAYFAQTTSLKQLTYEDFKDIFLGKFGKKTNPLIDLRRLMLTKMTQAEVLAKNYHAFGNALINQSHGIYIKLNIPQHMWPSLDKNARISMLSAGHTNGSGS